MRQISTAILSVLLSVNVGFMLGKLVYNKPTKPPVAQVARKTEMPVYVYEVNTFSKEANNNVSRLIYSFKRINEDGYRFVMADRISR